MQSQFPARPHAALVLLLTSIVAYGLAATAYAHDASQAAAGESYRHLRGLGPAKAAGKGLLRVKLKDEQTVLTHGLDPGPRGVDAAPPAGEGAPTIGGPERRPVCASDYHQHVLYGYPSDRQSRLASVKQTIIGEIQRMDAALNEEALASGGRTADYKVRCDGDGEIRVDSFQTTQPDAQSSFAGVVSAARAAGFDAENADYTIFFDSSAPPACGTATMAPDQRLSSDNANNSGRDYAVVYSDCWTDRTAMHETAHNQGAVQYDAPFSTGNGGHCNDGYDVMCYSDGGDKDLGLKVFCQDKMRFDCRYDTYFDAAPEAGEYLERNWNLGSPLNRFIAFDAPAPQEPACADGLDNDGDGRRDYPGDPGCAASSDTDERDPVRPTAVPPTPAAGRTYAGVPGATLVSLPALQPLPTLTMGAARRHARTRIKRRNPRAKTITTSCARRTRTSAACRVGWRLKRPVRYRGKMVVSYRYRGGEVALATSSRVRRVR